MKARVIAALLAILVFAMAPASHGQMIKRTDAVWARTTASPITLDGKLTESAWAVAESIHIKWGESAGMPGSGWHNENGNNYPPLDPTDATVKFLVNGDTLYVGVVCRDKSIGAGGFNNFDGLLMNMHYKQATGFQGTPYLSFRTNQACELFYSWWTDDPATAGVGALPSFRGDWPSPAASRSDSLKGFWDAMTTVQGTSNDDATPDTSYTMELKFVLPKFGYNVKQAGGDILMWNVSIYDADYQWPLNASKQSGNRTWLQGPWGNQSERDHLSIFVRSDVTTNSGLVPTVGPDLVIPASTYPSPVIDGKLDDPVWKNANIGTLQIQFGNNAIRNAYPNTSPYRSGQVQPTVNGSLASVVDPNLVTVKYFFKADTLFLGFDVQDKVVQAYTDASTWPDRADGFRVTINDRTPVDTTDHFFDTRQLTFIVGADGKALRMEDLAQVPGAWDSSGQAVQVALALRGETKLDTLGRTTPDSGYTAEMRIVLTKFGYPSGRGDGVLFLGITEFDGDSFSLASRSYGTRTWFMREHNSDDGPAWCYMDPSTVLSVEEKGTRAPDQFALLGNYPNPFNPSTTIKFAVPHAGEVTLEVFDLLGRLVAAQSLGVRQAGEQAVQFNAASLASGVYHYRLRMSSAQTSVVGKMILLK
jgi:hypothetical protein